MIGASNELKDIIKGLDWNDIQNYGHKEGAVWEFSPGNAPWYNGATEALVKSVKRALNAIIGEHILTFSELQTVLFEAFQLVNQRPIGRHPSNPEEGSYLCLNDLILGRASTHVPQGPFKERSSVKYRLYFVQQLVHQFWNKWTRDLFPNLIIQTKWHVERRNVQIDDVVMIEDSNMLRGQFKMGIVAEVFQSQDGKVRKVKVSYKNNDEGPNYNGKQFVYIERPVHKLIVIVPAGSTDDANTEEHYA